MTRVAEATRIADGVFLVRDAEGRSHVVSVAGPADDRWVHWNGRVFRRSFSEPSARRAGRSAGDSHESLSAPMPATVLKVLATPGADVRKGETLVILEAMKMELPVRAPADARIALVACHEGQLVQAGAVLVELE